jgi:hypothetical protein
VKHRRVWVINDPSFDAGSRHPEGCLDRGTWCKHCGCCEHCFHDCECTEDGCGCGISEFQIPEPQLFVVEDETP